MRTKNVLLIHDDKMQLPYYRVQIYGYLHNFLKSHGYDLVVVADGFEKSDQDSIGFPLCRMKFGLFTLIK